MKAVSNMYWACNSTSNNECFPGPVVKKLYFWDSDKQKVLDWAREHTQNTGNTISVFKVRMIQKTTKREPPVVEIQSNRTDVQTFRRKRKWEEL